MKLVVYTVKRFIYVECDQRRTIIKHRIPKYNKYLKEELRRFVEEVSGWLTGAQVDEIEFYYQDFMTLPHMSLYTAVLRACRRKDGVVLVTAYKDTEEVGAHGSSD